MPFGTLAPSTVKRLGSRRKSTTSCSSAFASSAPATSAQPIDALESGLISCGLVRGIIFIVFQMKTTISAMKMIGAQVMISGSIRSHRPMCAAATSVTWDGVGVGVAVAVLDRSKGGSIATEYRRVRGYAD